MRGVWGGLLFAVAARAQVTLPKSQLDLQREAAHGFEPAALALRPTARARGEPRILKLRVYATADFRAQTFEWQARFRRTVERVNRALADWPGVRFESAHFDQRADELLTKAESQLARKQIPELYKIAAQLRRELNEPGLAFEDAQKSGGDVEIARWAVRARRHTLIPENALALGLPPTNEGEYVRNQILAMQAIDGGQTVVAEMLAHTIEEAFPRLPAAAYLRCSLALKKTALARAETECKKSLAGQPDAIPPQHALMEIEKRRGNRDRADRQRAAELDSP